MLMSQKIHTEKELLNRISDLELEIKKLKDRKKYGLVWEEKPEDVVSQCRNNVPILKEVKNRKIVSDNSNTTNLLIEGDNYHSLSVLNYTHKGKIDVIYIDPPYNTGATDWKYNNDYVDSNDVYRHSKFISFINNRLRLSYDLLSDTGILICAIDEYEFHNIRHLLDQCFGEDNKLGIVTVLHNPKGRNLSKFFSANSEYMLVYAKDAYKAEFNDVVIDEGIGNSFDLSDKDGKYRLEPFMRSRTVWSRENRPNNWYPIYVSKDLKHITHEKTRDYYEIFPVTKDGKEMAWKNILPSFKDLNKNSYFTAIKANNRVDIYHKYREQQVFKNVWTDKKYQSEFNGTNLLKEILNSNVFNYPKSLYLLEDILKITSKENSIILDFFAGSGTTGHAVLELNKQDGGNRKFILCTNNENNICEEITYERIKRVIKGYKNNNGIKVEGIGGNLSYYKTDLVSVEKIHKISDESKIKVTYQAGEMIAVREDTLNEIEKNDWWQIFEGNKKYTAIYFKEDKTQIQKLIQILEKKGMPVVLYVFGWGKNEYRNEYGSDLIHVEDIPEPILEVYKEINRL